MHWWEQPVRGTLVCQHHMRNSKLEKICFQQKSRWSFFVLVLNENFKTQSIFKPWNSICSKKSQTSECLHPNTSLLLLLKQHNKDMLDLQPSQCYHSFAFHISLLEHTVRHSLRYFKIKHRKLGAGVRSSEVCPEPVAKSQYDFWTSWSICTALRFPLL